MPHLGPLKKPRMRPLETANASFLTLSSRRRSNATEKGLLKKFPEGARFFSLPP